MPNIDNLYSDKKHILYQAIIGSLIFTIVEIYLNIAFGVSIVSQHLQNSR